MGKRFPAHGPGTKLHELFPGKKARDLTRSERRAYERRCYAYDPQKQSHSFNKYKAKLKKQFFDRYGSACACCGEDDEIFLTVEHIGGGGAAHRKQLKRESVDSIISDIRRRGWPDGYATLCMNCNFARWRNKGLCPHEAEIKKIVLGIVA